LTQSNRAARTRRWPAATRQAIAFNHRGDQLVTASADGSLRARDARYGEASCGREIVALEWHSDAVNDVRFDPTDNAIFTASDDESGTQQVRHRDRSCATAVEFAHLRGRLLESSPCRARTTRRGCASAMMNRGGADGVC